MTSTSTARKGLLRRRETGLEVVVDAVFFFLGAVTAGWLAVLTAYQIFLGGIGDWWLVLVLWILLAYLLLPRLNTILARIYVPNYFIGRTRTYEGLLGDPVNVALLGSEAQAHAAMTAAGWRLADELGFRSGLRIVTSTLSRRTYPTAPVSPLYVFGRMQDFTYQQEVDDSPARRHHVRFWRTPEGWRLPGGAAVDWVAAGTYDRRVGFSAFTLQITHKIDGDTDVERDHIVKTVLDANADADESVISNFATGYHSRNGGGDAIETDGDLPVLDVRRLDATSAPLPKVVHHLDLSRDHLVEQLAGHTLSEQAKVLTEQARAVVETVQDTSSSNRVKRPMGLYIGYGLVLFRGLVAVGTAAVALAETHELATAAEWAIAIVLLVIAAVAYVVVGQLTFRGHRLARFTALTLSAIGVGLAAFGRTAGVISFDSLLWVPNLSLDIGILFTLSAADVRVFDGQATARRAARKAARAEARKTARTPKAAEATPASPADAPPAAAPPADATEPGSQG